MKAEVATLVIGCENVSGSALEQYLKKQFDSYLKVASVSSIEKYDAFNYKLKPVDLQARVNRSLQRQGFLFPGKINVPSCLMPPFQNHITIPTGEGSVILDVNKLIRCKASTNCIAFTLNDGKKIISSQGLEDHEILLASFSDFIRVHRSYLVNTAYISEIQKQGYIMLKDKAVIPVSRRKKDQVLKMLSIFF